MPRVPGSASAIVTGDPAPPRREEGATGTLVVTGAGSGIGRATALAAARAGWSVWGCDVDARALTSLHRELARTQAAGELQAMIMDVTDPEAVAGLFDSLERSRGGVLGLVNNAGVYLGRSWRDYVPHEAEQVLRVNLLGPILCTAALASACERTGSAGVIVNVGSVSGQEGSSDPVYGASKAGLTGLTRSAALALAPRVRVNEIALGLVDTGLTAVIPPARMARYRERELVARPITPAAVARAILFLLSPDAEHFTGATLDMNNGCYIR